MNEAVSLPVSIPVQSHFRDHTFDGKAVLPAVEAMQTLAASVKAYAPGMDAATVLDARFDKFLVIPENDREINALCKLIEFESGTIEAILQTKTRIEKAGFTRVKEHACASFQPMSQRVAPEMFLQSNFPAKSWRTIPRDQVYDQLVPFGPAYQTIDTDVKICEKGAVATVLAPDRGKSSRETSLLGSPFVLDGAVHAACVWGQRYCGLVAFPVSIESRAVVQPTQCRRRYSVHVFHRRTSPRGLLFDLKIMDMAGDLYEVVRGVRMRDVSAARMRPPSWIMPAES